MQDLTTLNKYAYFPIFCDCCGRLIFLRKYKRIRVKHYIMKCYKDDNICENCVENELKKLLYEVNLHEN